MSQRPTQYVIANALAKNPPFEGDWTTVYFNSDVNGLNVIGWRHNGVLLMASFNVKTGAHVRTYVFAGDNLPPTQIGFNDLLERLVTE